jgi:hypothetical protein
MPDQQSTAQDWYPLKQADFSGGVNIIDDPADLAEKEVADTLNVRLTTKNTVEQRLGYTEYNTNAIGASTEIRSLFHYKDYSGALIPLAQCSGNALYKGSAAFPGTAASFTSIFSETASSTPAFIDAMWGTLIYVNGVDVPQTWEGTYGKCQGFKVTDDIGVTYQDYGTRVSDEDPLTYAVITGLDTTKATNHILIKSRVPKLTGIKVVMDGTNVNAVKSDLVVEYRSTAGGGGAGAWTEITAGYVDGTSTGTGADSITFAQSGDVTWTEITIVPDIIDNSYGYFLRLSVTVKLSVTAIRIRAVYLYYNIQPLPSFWDGKFIKPDGFVKTVDTNVTFVDYTLFVTDDASSTVAEMGAFPITAGFFYIKSVKKFRAAFLTMSVEALHVNTTASVLTANYWNGTDWTALTIIDGTSANGKTMAQSGLISWVWPTAAETRRVGQDTEPFHVIQFVVSATVSTDVDVAEVEIIEVQDALRPMKGAIYHKNRLFMWGQADAPNYLFFSKQYLPDVWTGDDAGNIGIPSGKPITACARFYNDLMIATDDEIYILQGYTPATFGLLKINTGGIGVSAPHSVVSVGKMIYFMHATGFYRFDGIGIIYLSKNIRKFFDDKETAHFIPAARYEDIQGRFQRVWSCVEWTVSKGAVSANNFVLIFEIDHEGWWFDNMVISAFLKTEGATYQDLWYHGDYVGKVYRDYNGTSDNGTAISAYVTTRALQIPGYVGWTMVVRGVRAKLDVQTAGSLTVEYALSGATSFTAYGTMLMTGSGYTFVVRDIYDPLVGTAIQFKLSQAVKDYTFSISEFDVFVTPVRSVGVGI